MNSKPLPMAVQSPRLSRTPYRVDSPFTRVATALHEMGHRPIPLVPGKKYPGRYLGRSKGWVAMTEWQEYCKTASTEKEISLWSRWPDANVGVAFSDGFIAIDFDDDVAGCHGQIKAIVAELPGVIVQRRGAKGYQQYFRAEGVKTKVYVHSEIERNMLEVLAHGRQGVAAPSIHPDTGREYGYLSYRELTDTPLEDLPLITAETIARIENVLKAHGWIEKAASNDDGEGHGDAPDWWRMYRGENYGHWVPKLSGITPPIRMRNGFKCVPLFRPSNSNRPTSQRKLNLHFTPEKIIDRTTGDHYSPGDLVAASEGLDEQAAWRWLNEHIPQIREAFRVREDGAWELIDVPQPPALPPHDAVQGRPELMAVEAARQFVGKGLDDFFGNVVPLQMSINAERDRLTALLEAGELPIEEHARLCPENTGITLLHVTTGVGKTSAAIPRIIEAARQGYGIVVALPEHHKCKDFANDLHKAGCDVKVAIWRGLEEAGCRRLDEAKALQSVGVGVESRLCMEIRPDSRLFGCPYSKECVYSWQLDTRARIWIVPHAALMTRSKLKLDTGRDRHDILVIDEDPLGNAVTLPKTGRSLAGMNVLPGDLEWQGALLQENPPPDEVADIAGRIVAALTGHVPAVDGDIPHNWHREFHGNVNIFTLHDVKVEDVDTLITYLNKQDRTTRTLPAGEVKDTVKQAADKQKKIKRWAGLVRAVHDILVNDIRESGRVWVRAGSDGLAVYTASVKLLDGGWALRTPVLMMDATPAPHMLIEAATRRKIGNYVRAAARNSRDVTFIQIKDAPVRKGDLVTKAGEKGAALDDIDSFCRSAASAIGNVLMVSYKDTYPHSTDQEGLARASSGRMRGSNAYEKLRGLIVAHSASQGIWHAEHMVGAVTGTMPPHYLPPLVTGGSHKKSRIERERVLCRSRNGAYFIARQPKALSPEVTQFYRYQADSTLDQIVGRLRAVNRDGFPGVVIVFSDEPLPFEVDAVVSWHQAKAMGGAALVSAYAPKLKEGHALKESSLLQRDPPSPVIAASSGLAMLIEPKRFTSIEAGKSHYRRHAPQCPPGWLSTAVLPKGTKSWQVVFHDPAVIALDDLPAVLERMTGRPCAVKHP